jgi:hypothetical protein
MKTITVNLTSVFIYTIVFVILTSIVYFIITRNEDEYDKRLFRGSDIFLSSIISVVLVLIYKILYEVFCNVSFVFTF